MPAARERTSRSVESRLPFTVDAALLRELGERLVGKPHIALAELIKNGYDADATIVEISVGNDSIEVADNGHGMTFEEFRDFWMRVGSPHKEAQGISRMLGRALTGSKGVGRLAVQFLAGELEMETIAADGAELVEARVDWSEAVTSVDLTSAEALYTRSPATTAVTFPGDSAHGTRLRMKALRHSWSPEDFEDLAREVWVLQPPFAAPEGTTTDFAVVVNAADTNLVGRFENQMRAWIHLWHARLRGETVQEGGPDTPLRVRLTVTFEGEQPRSIEYDVPNSGIRHLKYEIRVFSLKHRQRFGISVKEARQYLLDNGGVHIYDAGFHLPYYGPETDWLGIEMAHSHRLSSSKLLPEELQVPEGLNYLPTNSRLFGVVNVDTARERREADGDPGAVLQIQVSRDRLVANAAFDGLRRAVRWAVDYYAMQEARRAFDEAARRREAEPLPSRLDEVTQLVERFREDMSQPAYDVLRRGMKAAVRAQRAESKYLESQSALLGALASAGMAALAIEHEVNVQLGRLRTLARRLQRGARRGEVDAAEVDSLSADILRLVDRVVESRRLFNPLLDSEDRERVESLNARAVVASVLEQVKPLLRGIPVNVDLPPTLTLPPARLVDWSALLQNVFVNAVNAMLDVDDKRVLVTSRSHGRRRSLLVEDTGAGVDLESAGELFEPFVRRTDLSRVGLTRFAGQPDYAA